MLERRIGCHSVATSLILFELSFFALDCCQNVHESSARNLSRADVSWLDVTVETSNLVWSLSLPTNLFATGHRLTPNSKVEWEKNFSSDRRKDGHCNSEYDPLITRSRYSILSASTGLIEAPRIVGIAEATITTKTIVTDANASTSGSKGLT
jgi:hypothetical protein